MSQIPLSPSFTIFEEVKKSFDLLDDTKKAKLVSQVKGVFEFHVKNEYNGEAHVFTIDLKDKGSVYSGESGGQADTVFYIADNDFISIAKGKMTSQRAYTLSKLKIKGQIKLATRLDTVLKQLRGKSRL